MTTKMEIQQSEQRTPTSLVTVKINDRKLVYFCDIDIANGDLVEVEGKLCDHIGRVVNVNTHFKQPPYDMQWISAIANPDISGTYQKWHNEFVSLDSNIQRKQCYQICTMKKARESTCFGNADMQLVLDEVDQSSFWGKLCRKFDKITIENQSVVYLQLKDGVGSALVEVWDDDDDAEVEFVEVDFCYENDKVTYIACECNFDDCYHVFETLLTFKHLQQQFGNTNVVMISRSATRMLLQHNIDKIVVNPND